MFPFQRTIRITFKLVTCFNQSDVETNSLSDLNSLRRPILTMYFFIRDADQKTLTDRPKIS